MSLLSPQELVIHVQVRTEKFYEPEVVVDFQETNSKNRQTNKQTNVFQIHIGTHREDNCINKSS